MGRFVEFWKLCWCGSSCFSGIKNLMIKNWREILIKKEGNKFVFSDYELFIMYFLWVKIRIWVYLCVYFILK